MLKVEIEDDKVRELVINQVRKVINSVENELVFGIQKNSANALV